MANTLYICYFSLREPLVETQVIPYLIEIAKAGTKVSLVTFEPSLKQNWTDEQVAAMRATLAKKQIAWDCLAYHKRPSAIATAYDIVVGTLYVRRKIREGNIDILHGRVHVPTLMGAIARRLSRRKPKLLFDIRGFFPEEYTDAGVWPENGWMYRSVKRVERWLMKESDAFVVLTEKAREILFPGSAETGFDELGRPVEVIPCCVDLSRFEAVQKKTRNDLRSSLMLEDRLVIAYVGSFGGWYLSEEMYEFLKTARKVDPRVFAMILTQRDLQNVKLGMESIGFGSDDFLVKHVLPAEVPEYLSAADFSLSFILRCYSKLGASPTKIAEYLACGLPIIANPGVGDVDELINGEGVGVLVDKFDRESYLRAIDELFALGDIQEKCRETATRRFDLKTVGGPLYRRLYECLFCNGPD